jgi:hypothetical protein
MNKARRHLLAFAYLTEERKMGQLVDGVWQDVWYDTKSTGGRFRRSVSVFRNWLTADGAPGPGGEGVLRLRKTVITSMFPSPARGHTAP